MGYRLSGINGLDAAKNNSSDTERERGRGLMICHNMHVVRNDNQHLKANVRPQYAKSEGRT